MNLSFDRRSALFFAAVGVVGACQGCIPIGAGIAVAVGGGSNSQSASPAPPVVTSAAITSGSPATGTVALDFVVTDGASLPASVEVLYSTGADDETKPFPNKATGTIVNASGTTVTSPLPTSPGGTTYVFQWNSQADVGSKVVPTTRLQITLGGTPAFTVPSFEVDNTTVPQVTATLPPLPSGASFYADQQGGAGFIPLGIVVTQAQSIPIGLEILVSTNGGASYPNQGAGQLVMGAQAVPLSNVPTSPSGISYQFHLSTSATGLGASGPQAIIVRVVATENSKTSNPSDLRLTVDNAVFAGGIVAPQSTQITDKVDAVYSLFDTASESLAVQVQFTLDGGVTWSSATESTNEPPDEGTAGLSSSPSGVPHHFLWNAFADMKSPFTSTVVHLRVSVTNPATQVTVGPFQTGSFTVDQRLMETVFGRTAGVHDGALATQENLVSPDGVVLLNNRVFFADSGTNRVRVVDLTTGVVETVFGGGSSLQDGIPGTEFGLESARGLAVDPSGVGAIFVSGTTVNGDGRIFRLDGASYVVNSLVQGMVPNSNSQNSQVAFEPTQNIVYFDAPGPAASGETIDSAPATGGASTVVVGGGATALNHQIQTTYTGPTTVGLFFPVTGLAANWSLYPGLILFTTNLNASFWAANLGAAPVMVGGVTTNPNQIQLIAAFPSTQGNGVSISGPSAVDVCTFLRVLRYADGSTTPTSIVDVKNFEGFTGDGNPDFFGLINTVGVCGDGTGGIFFTDNGLTRVVHVVAPGTGSAKATTVAGTNPSEGDGLPAGAATLIAPTSIALVGSQLLVGDFDSSRIRGIPAATTVIQTIAGNGGQSTTTQQGDGGQATLETINTPGGMVAGLSGDFYFTEIHGRVVKNVSQAGVITTVAGQFDTSGSSPDGTPANQAFLSGLVSALAVSVPTNCLLIVNGNVVSAVNIGSGPTTCCGQSIPAGAIFVVVGSSNNTLPLVGTTAMPIAARLVFFPSPSCVAADASGNLYVSDLQQAAVFKIDSTGMLTTVAGTPGSRGTGGNGGPATSALLQFPFGLCLSGPVLYISDVQLVVGTGPDEVRAVNVSGSPVTANGVSISPGNIALIAGGGAGTDGIPATSAQLHFVGAFVLGGSNPMAADALGNLYFAELGGPDIRVVDDQGIIHTVSGRFARLDGDGLPADNALLTGPTAIAVDPSTEGFAVVDAGRIRFTSANAAAVVNRIAGIAVEGEVGDAGLALNASFNFNVAFDTDPVIAADGNGIRQIAFSDTALLTSLIAVADTMNDSIRIINASNQAFTQAALGLALPPGNITRLAGAVTVDANGVVRPVAGFAGDGSLVTTTNTSGTQTAFAGPEGVAFTSSGLLVVSDTGNDRLRAINLTAAPVSCVALGGAPQVIASGEIITIATGAGQIKAPRTIAFDPISEVLVFQQGDGAAVTSQISALNIGPGPVTAYGVSIAGGAMAQIDNNPPATATYQPRGVSTDPRNGDVYFANRALHVVLRIAHGTGITTLVAGTSGSRGFTGDGSPPIDAQLDTPIGTAVDSNGAVYILDAVNRRVRRCRHFP